MQTNRQDELLVMLAEECSEVIQVVSKALRHGSTSHHPDDPKCTTNRRLIKNEMIDILAVYSLLEDLDSLWDLDNPMIDKIRIKKQKYMHNVN